MSFYREQFPDASVIPKMHMLETHVVDWLNEWRVGLGLMGEQGAECLFQQYKGIIPKHPEWCRQIKMHDETALRTCCTIKHCMQTSPSKEEKDQIMMKTTLMEQTA